MLLIRLGDTNKPSMNQVLYYVYKNDEHMEEHAPKFNNIYIFPHKGHQVPKLVEDDDFHQDKLDPGTEEDYYSSDDKSCGGKSDT